MTSLLKANFSTENNQIKHDIIVWNIDQLNSGWSFHFWHKSLVEILNFLVFYYFGVVSRLLHYKIDNFSV